jgi:hypothetical protein
MPKLHELLAVEGQLKSQAQATRTELRSTFEKKRHLFEEKVTTFQPNEDGAEAVREQQSDLQSKVRDELAWIAGIWSQALDVSAQVADANTQAQADVTLEDGTVLLKAMPATGLLELEKRVAEIQELIKSIPTLDPAKGFQPDAQRGAHIYKARDVTKVRTKKTQRPLVLYPATPEHPAQTQVLSEDVPVGKVLEQEWSGLITPTEKANLLARAEAFGRAVKQARMRANDVELSKETLRKVGSVVFGYVFGV